MGQEELKNNEVNLNYIQKDSAGSEESGQGGGSKIMRVDT